MNRPSGEMPVAGRPRSSRRRSSALSGRACSWSTTMSATCSPSHTCSKIWARWSSHARVRRRSAICSRASSRSSSRRLHAGNGRLRNRPDHPRPRPDQGDPDCLPVGGQQGGRAPASRLFDGRGRLCVQAGRSDHPALQSGVFVELFEKSKEVERKARHEQACWMPTSRRMPGCSTPSRSYVAPSNARRRSSSRCRWCSI